MKPMRYLAYILTSVCAAFCVSCGDMAPDETLNMLNREIIDESVCPGTGGKCLKVCCEKASIFFEKENVCDGKPDLEDLEGQERLRLLAKKCHEDRIQNLYNKKKRKDAFIAALRKQISRQQEGRD